MKKILRRILFIALIALSPLVCVHADEAIDFSLVDKHAIDAPEFEDMADLVKYLIKPFPKNELFKARALYIWIASHMQYDIYKYNSISNTSNRQNRLIINTNVYQTRLGVCGDFADLFSKMARRAHLDSEIILGAAGYNLTPEKAAQSYHAWNAVKINNQWRLLDITWSLQGKYTAAEESVRRKEYKKMIKERKKDKNKEFIAETNKKSINDYWFLIDPEEMIKTHFPEKIKWQLLKKPVTPHKIWRANEKNQQKPKKKK